MRNFFLPLSLCLFGILPSCEKPKATNPDIVKTERVAQTSITEDQIELIRSVVRINSTSQTWNVGQPWEKRPPEDLYALGAIVGPDLVVTTGEVVADSTYLEMESPDGSRVAQAKIIAVDYEANLALLTVKSDETRADFFKDTQPLELAAQPVINDELKLLQVEENGTTLLTDGSLKSVDVLDSFVPGQIFLTYLVKASMQSAASSFSLPVLRNQQLVGILTSYDSEDQISNVIALDVLSRFIENAKSGAYQGFPSMGISVAQTIDPSFRQFLKIEADLGGVYVEKVRKGGSAQQAGILKGDVILSINGYEIDKRGFYEHPNYGRLYWAHIVRGEKSTGEVVNLKVQRDGKPLDFPVTLKRENPKDKIVPDYLYDQAPNYLVKGGFIFQELSRPALEIYGDEWVSRAPLNLMDAYQNPEKFEGILERVVYMSATIPTPATVGYERLRNLIVKKVNGEHIKNMKSLINTFEKRSKNGLHSIEFMEEDFTIYLDEEVSSGVDSALLQRGLNRLSRAE